MPPRPGTAADPADRAAPEGVLAPLAWPTVLPLAAAKVALQLLTATLYGAHRDEFYYLESGHHLAWGYVDNPPLVPVVYRLEEAAFGHGVTALAVVPALLGGVYVVLGALLAREVGGGRFAQLLTAVVAWLGSIFLTASHFLSTVSVDLALWAVGSLLVLRIVRTGDRRWWLAVGVVVGAGCMNKYTMAFWVVATLAGLLLTPQRRLLASWWLLAGAAVAGVIVAPDIAWQIANHWPTLEFLRHLRASGAHDNVVQFVPVQVVLMTLGGAVVWVTALVTLVRPDGDDGWGGRHRWLAVGYAVAFVVLLVLAGKPYYLGSWYLPLVAAGAVAVERRWRRTSREAVLAGVVVSGLLLAPYATPVLPQATAVRLHLDTANADLGAMMGWPSVVGSIAHAYRGLPAGQRSGAVILTGNYSEAGAVDFYGPGLGLPPAISGQNSFWTWGYGHPAPEATVIVVGLPAAVVRSDWASVVRDGTLGAGPAVVDPHERGKAVWVCRGQRAPWAALWPSLRHYD